jgi:hypothetical protein
MLDEKQVKDFKAKAEPFTIALGHAILNEGVPLNSLMLWVLENEETIKMSIVACYRKNGLGANVEVLTLAKQEFDAANMKKCKERDQLYRENNNGWR